MIRMSDGFRISFKVALLTLGLMVSISAPDSAEQARTPRRPDPQTQMLNNYRKYPDRYIRISGETWKYDEPSQIAFHSFTLQNIAGVAYSDIEMRVKYLNPGGKTLQSQILLIPGILQAYQIRKVKGMKVRNVPRESDQAILAVTKALIRP